MAKRRDAITAQLASLRDVVAGFGEDEVVERRPGASCDPVTEQDDEGSEGIHEPTTDYLGEPGPPSTTTHRSTSASSAAWACWSRSGSRRRSQAIGSTLMLIVVSLFLAAGLDPAVRFFERRGMRRSLRRAHRDRGRAGRARALPGGDRAGHRRPGPLAHRQRAGLARPAAAQPAGPAARRRVRHHRQDPGLRHRRRLRRRASSAARSASGWPSSARSSTASSSSC